MSAYATENQTNPLSLAHFSFSLLTEVVTDFGNTWEFFEELSVTGAGTYLHDAVCLTLAKTWE